MTSLRVERQLGRQPGRQPGPGTSVGVGLGVGASRWSTATGGQGQAGGLELLQRTARGSKGKVVGKNFCPPCSCATALIGIILLTAVASLLMFTSSTRHLVS